MAQHVKDELNFSPNKKLAGERNADSVLFNVSELETIERSGASSPSLTRLSTTIETTGSGLIDLRKLVDATSADAGDRQGAVANLVAPQGSTLLVSPPSEAEAEDDVPPEPVAAPRSVLPTVLMLVGGLAALVAVVALALT